METHLNQRGVGDVDRRIAQRVRLARKSCRFTQQQLAEMIGVTFQQVQKYEKGANRISAGRLGQIATALECDITYFFDDDMPVLGALGPARLGPDLESLSALRALPETTLSAIDQLLVALTDRAARRQSDPVEE